MPELLQEFVRSPYFGLALFNVAIVWPIGRILRRAGLSPWWAALALIPFGYIVTIGLLAHRRWPNLPARVTPVRKERRSL